MMLSEIKQRLEDVRGPIISATEEGALYERVINDAYQEIASLAPWWWLEKQVVKTISGVVVTKTMTLTNGQAGAVPEVGEQVSSDYLYGTVYTGTNYYRITAVNSASPYTLTFDSEVIDDTADYDLSIWNDTIVLPDDFDSIVSVSLRGSTRRLPLSQISEDLLESLDKSLSSSVPDRFCILRETDKEYNYHLRFYPHMTTEQDLLLRYQAIPVSLSNDSQEPLIPTQYQFALVARAKYMLAINDREDPDVIGNFGREAQSALNLLWSEQNKRGRVKHQIHKRRMAQSQNEIYFRLVNTTGGV